VLTALPLHLQTQQGRPALAMPREEFMDNLRSTIEVLEGHGWRRQQMRFSWDHAHVNGRDADMPSVQLRPAQRLLLPTGSPDCHRVIEHQVGMVKRGSKKAFMARGAEWTPQTAQAVVRQVFRELRREDIAADVESLPLAWEVLAAPKSQVVSRAGGKEFHGTAGDWLPRELR
jgi:hypothetical protein